MKLSINNSYLKFDNKVVEFTKILRTRDKIECYIDDKIYCTFRKPRMESFVIHDGEFTEENVDEIMIVNQTLAKRINALTIENKQNEQINKILAQQLNNINIKLVKGGIL